MALSCLGSRPMPGTLLWVWGAGNSRAGTGTASGGKALSSVISQESTHEQVFGVFYV